MRFLKAVLGTTLFLSLPKDSIFGGVSLANGERDEVTAPDKLLSHEAFAALYNYASSLGIGRWDPNAYTSLKSLEHAKEVYNKECPDDYCDYVYGKPIKTSFKAYPKLNTWSYDRYHGKGSMVKALTAIARGKSKYLETDHVSKRLINVEQRNKDEITQDMIEESIQSLIKRAQYPMLYIIRQRCADSKYKLDDFSISVLKAIKISDSYGNTNSGVCDVLSSALTDKELDKATSTGRKLYQRYRN